MKVGVLQFFSWSRRIPLTTVYERAFARIDVMDRTGYDCVWLAEHHFSTYSVCPSINVMATHVAARTKHLRIGLAVSLAAFYNPLRLAEEVALVDVLSGGRVNWGAGRGFDRHEFEAFGVPPEESSARFRECVDIVLTAWRNERLTYAGEFWRYENIEIRSAARRKRATTSCRILIPPTRISARSARRISRSSKRTTSRRRAASSRPPVCSPLPTPTPRPRKSREPARRGRWGRTPTRASVWALRRPTMSSRATRSSAT
jgi:hypothetical protein